MSSEFTYPFEINPPAPRVREQDVENALISKLRALKYEIRDDITDRTYYFANNIARHFAFNADTAMRESAIPSCGATLRSMSAAKDNRCLPSYEFPVSQRDTAYQPRATPWVCHAPALRVLKERRISPNGGRVTNQPLRSVPSERMNCIPRIPRVTPCPGLHPSLVCNAPLGHESR